MGGEGVGKVGEDERRRWGEEEGRRWGEEEGRRWGEDCSFSDPERKGPSYIVERDKKSVWKEFSGPESGRTGGVDGGVDEGDGDWVGEGKVSECVE